MTGLVPTALGSVNTWQCDENDHLNVQFYAAFAYDGSMQLCGALGYGPALRRAGDLRLSVAEDHIRYYRELRREDVVAVASAPVMVDESGALVVYNEIRNIGENAVTVAATVRSVLRCRTAAGVAVPWPATMLDNIRRCTVPLPEAARPRSAGKFGPLPDIRLADAMAAGLVDVGRSVVLPAECDEHGALLPRFHFSRYSDGAAGLWQTLGFGRAALRARQRGTVVLEMKNQHRRPLAPGSLTVVMSALIGLSDKALHFAHFLFDAETGDLAATAEAVAVLFDQQARRALNLGADNVARLAPRVVTLEQLQTTVG